MTYAVMVVNKSPNAVPTTVIKIDTPYALMTVMGVLKISSYAAVENSLGKSPYPWNRIACSEEKDPDISMMNGSRHVSATIVTTT